MCVEFPISIKGKMWLACLNLQGEMMIGKNEKVPLRIKPELPFGTLAKATLGEEER